MNILSTIKTIIHRNATLTLPIGTLATISTQYPNFYTAMAGQTIACSSDGVYMSVCASGVILSTSNSGVSFTTNTFSDGTYSVGMNPTGQYQVAISTGNPSCSIYVSTNYGVSWTNKKANITTANNGRWTQSIAIDNTGQYMFVGGGGGSGLQSYYSKDYGNTWTMYGSIDMRASSTLFDNSIIKVFFTSSSNNVMTSTITDTTPVETVVSASVVSGLRRITSNGNNIVYCGTTSFIGYSANGGTSFSAIATPVTFSFIFYSGTVLWATTSTNVYKSTDNGTSWTTVLSGLSIKSVAVGTSNNRLYVAYTTGEVVATSV